MFNKDYIMREIENLSGFLTQLIFNKRNAINEVIDEKGHFSESGFLFYRLMKKVHEGKINEAEDELFKKVDNNPTAEYLKAAIDFYSALDELSDEKLIECGFPREEILEGLKSIRKIYGVLESDHG